jgi:DnaJ-class molecular chaperone
MSDNATTDKKWARTIADDGHALCPDCRGRGWCKWCRGTGRLLADTTKHCDACAGKGECLVCDGNGQLPEGHYVLTDFGNDGE